MDYKNELERNKKMDALLKSRMGRLSPQALQARLQQALPERLLPGNVGDINNVFWPFFFTFTTSELPPNSGFNASVTITQEAAFILLKMTKVVFRRSGAMAPFVYTAINALDSSEAISNANDLNITIRDAQSTRVFFGLPTGIDEIGCAEFPTKLPVSQLFLPNSTIECIYQNTNAVDTFVPFITLFGYRLRLDNAAAILSTVTG